ncbi:MAG: D-alanyl-D-alanine carboxypeptidase family protein [Ahrensia sp.]
MISRRYSDWMVCARNTFALVLMVVALAACSTTETLDIAPVTGNPKYAALVIDAKDGRILHEAYADQTRYPASLTKMMTIYLMFDALRDGRVTPQTEIPISENAAKQPASKLYLRAGSTITVDQAIRALAVKSANDVATAVAEYFGGTEDNFAQMMTTKAQSLGMRATVFRNASGLTENGMRTTARDMALLAMALQRNHPRYMGYFTLTSFEYGGKTITGHNNVLVNYPGATGMKTGYTSASGSNLVTTAQRNNRSVIAVVLGGQGSRARDERMTQLLDAAFQRR